MKFVVRAIGLTGTRQGMTDAQLDTLETILTESSFQEAHHGDCIGADEQFHMVCEWLKSNGLSFEIVVHPPSNPKQRAFCVGDRVLPERTYKERDDDIVMDSDLLLAISLHKWEMQRSGTWNTVRFARLKGRQIVIIWPDGSTSQENGWRGYHKS